MADDKKKEVKQIVSGRVKSKSLAEKAGDFILSEDTRTVKNYLVWDVLIPWIKNGIADVVIGGIEMALFGSSRGRRSSSTGGNVSHVNYGSFSRNPGRDSNSRRVVNIDRSSRYDFNNIVLDSRGDAEEVIASMEDLIRDYGEATVADLNSLVGVTGRSYIDNKWGWTDCRDFHVSRSGRGYILDFAPPIYLD